MKAPRIGEGKKNSLTFVLDYCFDFEIARTLMIILQNDVVIKKPHPCQTRQLLDSVRVEVSYAEEAIV